MSGLIDIKVPDIGDFKDVPVIEIFVKPGDKVKAEDPLVALESDKATMEVPSPRDGLVKSVVVKVGDKVSEGVVIAQFEGAGAEQADTRPVVSAPPSPVSAPAGVAEVRVPDIGDFKDVPVIEIFVKPGDSVKAEDPLIAPELGKINFGPRQQVDAADAPSARGRGLRLGRRRPALSKGLDVFAYNAAMIARPLDLTEINAEFARQLAHRGAGISEREGFLINRASCRRGSRRERWRDGSRRRRSRSTRRYAAGRKLKDDRPLADLVAGFHLDLTHGPGEGRRHLHRCLVRLKRYQWILSLHAVARFHKN